MEPRSTADPDAPARPFRRRTVGARTTARDRARLQTGAPSSRRPHRRTAPRQVPGRPDDHGPRALRRFALGHALADAVSTDFCHEGSRRDRRGPGASRPCGSPGREDDLAAGDLRLTSRSACDRATRAAAGACRRRTPSWHEAGCRAIARRPGHRCDPQAFRSTRGGLWVGLAGRAIRILAGGQPGERRLARHRQRAAHAFEPGVDQPVQFGARLFPR